MTNPPGMPVPQTGEQAPEQLLYARLLDRCTRIGLVVLVLSFAAHVLGLAPAHVAVERLPEVWGQPVDRFIALTGSPKGWDWLPLLHRGDMAGLAGIALLAGCSIPCLLAVTPVYLRRHERGFALLCLAEVAVMALAASGWLAGGH